jgi:hypothetical protein
LEGRADGVEQKQQKQVNEATEKFSGTLKDS